MDDAVNVWVCDKDLIEVVLFGDIDLCELWSLAADQFDTVDGFIGGIVEVIGDYDLVASLQQCEGSERANVACATAMRFGVSFEDIEPRSRETAYPVTRTVPTGMVTVL